MEKIFEIYLLNCYDFTTSVRSLDRIVSVATGYRVDMSGLNHGMGRRFRVFQNHSDGL
jgi:hypothetical protein